MKAQKLSPEEIFAKADNSVVTVFSFKDNKRLAQGSGVSLNKKGFIVTNFHVFAGADKVMVKLKNKIFNDLKIIGVDVEKDMMILKGPDDVIPHLRIGSQTDLKVGQRVYAVGSPQGLENTFSEGIISGLRQIDDENEDYIQTTTAISPGSSGGALLNANGELIGICTMTLSSGGQLLNFAIPIDHVNTVKIKDYTDKKELDAFNYFFIGNNAYRSRDYKKAKYYFEKAIQNDPSYVVAYNNLGLCHDRLKDYFSAVDAFEKAVELDPQYHLAWNHLGVSYRHDKAYSRSIKSFMNAIKLQPKSSLYFYNAGLAYYSKGDLNDAIIYYKKATDLNPNYYQAFNNLGVVYFGIENYDQAIINYKKATEINPAFGDALYNLGMAYIKAKKYEDGVDAFRSAIQNRVRDIETYYNLAECYYMTQEYEDAIRFFLKVIERAPNYAKAHYFISLAFLKTGNDARAKQYRESAFAIKPNWRNGTEEQLWETVLK